MLKTKLVSSQVKAFLEDTIDAFAPLESLTALGGERVSVQLLYVEAQKSDRYLAQVQLEGDLAPFSSVRDVRCVPVDRPVNPDRYDDQYLRTEPGVYPDLLTPLRYGGQVVLSRNRLRSLWVEIEIPRGHWGTHTLRVTLSAPEEGFCATASVEIRVLAADLPEQKL